jgi:hypothetical protein
MVMMSSRMPTDADIRVEAMGEDDYDTDQMPQLLRPEVHWDHANPAQALAELADGLGCRVVLGLDNIVHIVPTGIGDALPTDPDKVIQPSLTINPPVMPDELMVVCGPTRYQIDVMLEPVGRDLDGQWKPVDQLSYTPVMTVAGKKVKGWQYENLSAPTNVGNQFGNAAWIAAVNTVGKCYRIAFAPLGVDGKPLKVPGYNGTVGTRYQILPIEDEQVQTFLFTDIVPQVINQGQAVLPISRPANLPAFVYGFFGIGIGELGEQGYTVNVPLNTPRGNSLVPGMGAGLNGVLPAIQPGQPPLPGQLNVKYERPFTIDKQQGIVTFDGYVGFFTPDPNNPQSMIWNFAILALRCACNVRDQAGYVPRRYEKTLHTGAPTDAGPRILQHDEIVLGYWGELGQQDNTLKEVHDNRKKGFLPNVPAVDDECDYYLNAAMLEYQTTFPQDTTYGGIVPISPDGAIQQVSWTVGVQGGAITRASRNSEFSLHTVPYRERRMLERLWGERDKLVQQDWAKRQAQAGRQGF